MGHFVSRSRNDARECRDLRKRRWGRIAGRKTIKSILTRIGQLIPRGDLSSIWRAAVICTPGDRGGGKIAPMADTHWGEKRSRLGEQGASFAGRRARGDRAVELLAAARRSTSTGPAPHRARRHLALVAASGFLHFRQPLFNGNASKKRRVWSPQKGRSTVVRRRIAGQRQEASWIANPTKAQSVSGTEQGASCGCRRSDKVVMATRADRVRNRLRPFARLNGRLFSRPAFPPHCG